MNETQPVFEFLSLVLVQQGRNCYGQLYLADDAIHFLCLADESAKAAAVGTAVAGQFGLLGALVGGAVAGVKGSARDKRIAEVLEKHKGLSLEEKMKLDPLSRTFRKDELLGFVESNWTGIYLETTGGRVPTQGMNEAHKGALREWCAKRGLKAEKPKKMAGRTKALLWLSPVMLVLLYVMVSLPWAVRKNSHYGAVAERYDQVLEKSKSTWEALGTQPVGADLETACGALGKVPLKGIVGYVGAIPNDGDKGVLADYERFPRTVEVMDYHGEADVYTMELARYRYGGSFGDAWGAILTEAPTDWNRRVRDVYPLRDFSEAKYLAVGRVREFTAPHREGYSGPMTPGRAELSIRVLDLESGKTACQGDLSVAFPPKDSKTTRNESEVLRDGLGAAAVLGLCQLAGEKLCEGAKQKAQQLAPGEPVAAAEPPPVVPAAAKRPTKPAKSPKKPARRR
ncbi:MAG: hypothetical protein ACYC8T_30300 [Myxococcaceae bacterium]